MTLLSARLELFGLSRYADLFAEHDIDIDVLADLTDADLEKLGISLGDRRRLLKAAKELAAPAKPVADQARDAERRQLTVMFADLVGSTSLAARLDPEEMKDVIGRYRKAVGDEVIRHGGHIAKHLGDGLLVYFGWPQAHEDDAGRAMRAALSSIVAVQGLSIPEGGKLGARIGIATGEVVVGDFVGTGLDEAGAVVGETPNLASRLQGLADENAIVVSEQTLLLVGRQFAFTDLGEQMLKGFSLPVRAWRLDGEQTFESRFDALHGDRLGSFIGREHEIGFLIERWAQACDGECQLVQISGEAGIGKSRLVSEVVKCVRAQYRISYQGSPLHTNTSLYPVLQQLQLMADFKADDTVADRFRKLASIIANGASPDRVALGYLADLMSLTAPGENLDEARPSADLQREAALEALASGAERLAAAGPLLIVVEDAHWLDGSTLELVERLLTRLQHSRVMLLITYRSEFRAPWAQQGNVGLLALSRLGRRHALAIVNSMITEGLGLPVDIADAIVAKSDGVPLFVEELTGAVLESAKSGAGQTVQIPSTLRDTLSERLDKLGSAKEVAQVAAAFGREFSIDLVAATLRRSEADLKHDLERLLAIDIVFQTSRSYGRFVFKHALLQEAAYESMLKSKRRELHSRIVQVLSQLRPGIVEAESELMANHFQRAGNSAEAASCWRKAGKIALQNSAYREAIGAFKKALDLGQEGSVPLERIDSNRAIATAYFAVADIMSVRRHLDQAYHDAETAGDPVLLAEIAIQRCHVLNIFGGRVTEAREAGDRGLSIAADLNDDQLAYGARFALGQSCWVSGEFRRGVEILTANIPRDLTSSETVRDFAIAGSLAIDSLATLGSCHGQLGEFERAFELFDQARTLCGRIHATFFDRMVIDSHPPRALLRRGDWAAAIPMLERNRTFCVDRGLRFSVPWQTGFLGYAQVLAGNVEHGISLLHEALNDCPAVHFEVVLQVLLVEALLRDAPATAVEIGTDTLRRCRHLGYRAQEAELLGLVGTALAEREPLQAETLVREGLSLAKSLGLRPVEAHAYRFHAGIQQRLGQIDLAGETKSRARSIYKELQMDYWLDAVA